MYTHMGMGMYISHMGVYTHMFTKLGKHTKSMLGFQMGVSVLRFEGCAFKSHQRHTICVFYTFRGLLGDIPV